MPATFHLGDALSAASAPSPYAYYAELTSASLLHDAENRVWLASSAMAVEAVLAEPLCRVRPAGEAVPGALLGSAAGDIFSRLVRMNDGASHCPFKLAVSRTLESVGTERIDRHAGHTASLLASQLYSSSADAWLDRFALQMPVYVVAGLLGVSDADLPEIFSLMQDFVACLAAGCDDRQLEAGKQAAGRLVALLGTMLEDAPYDSMFVKEQGLLSVLAQQAALLSRADTDVVIANGIGFMSQAYEATAGLIANTLHVLACDVGLRRQLEQEPGLLQCCIDEVLRWDPPVQNTRRFAAGDCRIMGQQVRAGDTVLVLLAAASRDPAVNPQPYSFDPHRPQRRYFSFGSGVHLCPGQQWAAQIAHAAVTQLCSMPLDFGRLAKADRFRASSNIRMRLFAGA
ncbi:cytochrome P450 [Undibacterium sp.]|uniref:cytochrome P450 n=1 Tax=Undibacterium sp. TaxID=1914977 RepID=UPI00374D7676